MSEAEQKIEQAIGAEEFAQAYAARSGVTVEWLKNHGREVAPCDCGEDGCEGWQMAYSEDLPPRE